MTTWPSPVGGFSSPITIERLVRYAGSSGDFNPLHYEADFAREAGFDKPVVVGSLTTALLLSEFITEHPVEDLRRVEIRFLAPVLADAELTCSFSAPEPSDDGTEVVTAEVLLGETAVMSAKLVLGGSSVAEPLPEDFSALGEEFAWPIEHGAARFFAQAVTSSAPEGPGAVVHPAFLSTAMRWSPSDRDFVQRLDFDFTRVVHGSTTLTFSGEPLRVGESLRVTEGHSGRRQVEGRSGVMTMADAHLIVRDDAGTERARLTYRIVERP